MHTNIRRIVALCCDDKKIEKHKRQQEKKDERKEVCQVKTEKKKGAKLRKYVTKSVAVYTRDD